MHQPELYICRNEIQRKDAKELIQEYSKILKGGYDSLLDAGCGTGDVLMDFIYPLMSERFKKIVGIDISSEMIEFTRKHYKSKSRCEFKQFDIACENEKLPTDLKEEFDMVTSFFCLNWVQNQRQALSNIYQFLKEGGNCFLVYIAHNAIFDAFALLSKSVKWSEFMLGINEFITPLQYLEHPQNEISMMLKDLGYSEYTVEIKKRVHNYKDIQTFRMNMKAVCPFLKHIPQEQHEEFMDDFIANCINLRINTNQTTDNEYCMPYSLAVVHGKK